MCQRNCHKINHNSAKTMPEQSKKRNPVFAIFSSLYNATTLFGPLFAYVLFTNVIQAVMLPISLLLPRKTVITFNSWIVGTVAIFFQHVFENVAKAKIVYYGDELPHRENAIMFANHLSFTDFMFLNGLANKKQMIHHLKYFAKDSLRYSAQSYCSYFFLTDICQVLAGSQCKLDLSWWSAIGCKIPQRLSKALNTWMKHECPFGL